MNKTFTNKQINEITNFLNLYLGSKYGSAFKKADDKVKWLLDNQDELLTNPQFVSKYDIESLITVPEKQALNFYTRFPDYDKLTKQQLERFENTTNISREDLKKFYDLKNQEAEEMRKFNEARYAELKNLSEEEQRATDNSYYNTPVANEYARKHYIQGRPVQAAINEGAGKFASIMDFTPFPFSLAGPAIRTAQKYAADEDVVTPGTGADFGGGALGILGKIPGVKETIRGTTGKIAQILNRSKSPKAKEISNVIGKKEIEESAEQASKELDKLIKNYDLDQLSNEEIIRLFNSTDNPVLKEQLSKVYKARVELEQARLVSGSQVVANKADELEKVNNEAVIEFAKQQPSLELKAGKGKPVITQTGDINPYYKNVPLKDVAENYLLTSKPSFISKAIGEGILGTGRKLAGQYVAHRKWDEINYKPDFNREKAINEIIKMYSNDWSLRTPPTNYNEPLIKEAYDKWLNDPRNKYNWDLYMKLEGR